MQISVFNYKALIGCIIWRENELGNFVDMKSATDVQENFICVMQQLHRDYDHSLLVRRKITLRTLKKETLARANNN